MAQRWMIHVVAEVSDCSAEVHVNDIPIAHLRQHESAGISMPVHQAIVSGDNELRLLVNPGPTPAAAAQLGSGAQVTTNAKARARVMVVPLGSLPSDTAKPLLEVNFVGAGTNRGSGPVTAAVQGPMPVDFGRRVWQSTPRLPALSNEVEASALAFVGHVRDVMQAGEARQLAPMLRARFVDVATSYGLDADAEMTAFIHRCEAFAKAPNWELAKVDREHASLRLCGGGRFIECVAKDWSPLIRVQDLSNGGMLFSMGIARSGNQWTVVY